ncbi:MAG: DUF1631 domain-containing protein [Halorhodospira halophila]|uniref:DUF1631 family protein n=1 Tax=Halorhodospira halophila TaxID=1053 RepID=UPI0019133140|nr:DUF1631 family protein [Halorhodospira halophila]MBK5935351.1 hypothetical protein [Halorhodospira halophila]MBK5944347.1 hypothetical protein [Halorhodospira halophila]MCC3751391.1 DUF1631 domain-containing protein [Halorhodospira halophila]MCG5527532.1 DUF1631 domain-containing protein [Halorhodospira halophila]
MSEADMTEHPPDNVVYLARTERGQGRAIPGRIERLRRHVEGRLVGSLRQGLHEAQERLHELAGGGEQGDAYRQDMQMVRLHRHDMEEVLRAGLEYRFAGLIDPAAVDPPPTPAHHSAAARILTDLRSRTAATTEPTTRALDAALPTVRVREPLNPLAAAQVADLLLRVQQRPPLAAPAQEVVLETLGDAVGRMLPDLHREAVAQLTGDGAADPAGPSAATSVADETRFAARAVRSRDRVEAARQRVSEEIERCLEGRRPPALIEQLIRDAWARLLLLIHLSDGADSENWVRHCAVMERLVWSVDTPPDATSRRRLVLEIPLLLHEVADGLREVLHDPFEVSKVLRALEAEYLNCLTRGDPGLAQFSARNDDTAAASHREGDVRRVAALPEGTWMEIGGAQGERLRVRLAGHTADGRLIFANRAGFKVLERSTEALAAAVADGQAKLLDDHELLNDGLSRVIRRLVERRAGHGE